MINNREPCIRDRTDILLFFCMILGAASFIYGLAGVEDDKKKPSWIYGGLALAVVSFIVWLKRDPHHQQQQGQPAQALPQLSIQTHSTHSPTDTIVIFQDDEWDRKRKDRTDRKKNSNVSSSPRRVVQSQPTPPSYPLGEQKPEYWHFHYFSPPSNSSSQAPTTTAGELPGTVPRSRSPSSSSPRTTQIAAPYRSVYVPEEKTVSLHEEWNKKYLSRVEVESEDSLEPGGANKGDEDSEGESENPKKKTFF